MFRKFFKYLLIGLSSLVLLAGAQQGLFNKQDIKLAEAASCTPGAVNPNTWTLIEEWECQPGNPGVKAHKWVCFNDSGVPIDTQYTDGVSDTDKCPIDSSPAQSSDPSQPSVGFACESNPRVCGANETFCENTAANQSTIFLKHEGACHPENGEHDANGCIFQFTPVSFQSFACGGQPQQPAQGGGQVQQQVQQAAAQPQVQQGFVCDNSGFSDGQGRWRVATFPADRSLPVCEVNNSSTFGGCKDGGASAGNICQAKTQAACVPNNTCSVSTPSACGQIATGVDNCGNACTRQSAVCQLVFNNNPVNTNTNTNTNTITVQNPTPQVITTQAAPVVFGNVGVGGTAYTTYTQPIQYTTLPKTGLPVLAWSALVFIPVGFRLRTFQKIKKALENHPSFIWEDRQFKV